MILFQLCLPETQVKKGIVNIKATPITREPIMLHSRFLQITTCPDIRALCLQPAASLSFSPSDFNCWSCSAHRRFRYSPAQNQAVSQLILSFLSLILIVCYLLYLDHSQNLGVEETRRGRPR